MKISISVPKPCHENWSAMTPATDATTGINGRHCVSCQHTVMDLTRVSDAQLIDLFRTDAMPKCARFSQGQLDRVIALEERSARLLPAAAVGAALALATPDAAAQNCTPTVGKMVARPVERVEIKTVGELVALPVDTTDEILQRVELGNVSIRTEPVVKGDIEVHSIPVVLPDTAQLDSTSGAATGQLTIRGGRAEVAYYIDGVKVSAGAGPGLPNSALEAVAVITGGIPEAYLAPTHGPFHVSDGLVIRGRVLDEIGQPAPFATIQVGNTTVTGTSDAEGRFVVTVPDSLYERNEVLRVQAPWYANTEVPLRSANTTPTVLDVPLHVEGKYALTGRALRDGRPIAGCIVEVVGAEKRIRTDANGFFGFDVPDGEREWTVRALAPDGSAGSTHFPASALPCCIPIALEAQQRPAALQPTTIDLGDITLAPREEIIMGAWAETIPAKQSLARRAGAPFRWLGRQVSRPFR